MPGFFPAFTVTFTTASLRTEAAYGCLKPAPTNRLRRVYLHLRYSIVLFEHVLGTNATCTPDTTWPVSRLSAMLIPENKAISGFDVFREPFRCFIGGSLSFVSLIHTCRGLPRLLTVTFTTATFRTEAAYGCLKPAPTNRLRRIYLHLGYSIVLTEHVLGTSPAEYQTFLLRWFHPSS